MNLVFFVWNNFTVINAANIKLNCFIDDEADLIVRHSPAISEDILKIIKESNVFRAVYYIETPLITKKSNSKIKRMLRLWVFTHNKKYKKQYRRVLSKITPENKYDLFFVAGYWGDALYALDYFYSLNRKIRVHFFDEGRISYYKNKKELCGYHYNQNFKERIITFLYLSGWERKYSKIVNKEFYLYSPKLYDSDSFFLPTKIPTFDEGNLLCYQLIHEMALSIEETIVMRYQKCNVIYLANFLVEGYEDNYDMAYRFISKIIEQAPGKSTIIKTHTNNTAHRLEFAKKFEKQVYVDRNVYYFESISALIDFNKKIFVTRASAIAMTMKCLFNCEPYLILTYRLFPFYHVNGDPEMDQCVSDLINLYEHKERIRTPNTMIEFTDILAEFYEQVLKDRYPAEN